MKVYIASPLKAPTKTGMKRNLALAALACRAAVLAGHRPFAPHLFYSSFLDDMEQADRKRGIEMGLAALEEQEVMLRFRFPGWHESEGMEAERFKALELRKPIFEIEVSHVSLGSLTRAIIEALEAYDAIRLAF